MITKITVDGFRSLSSFSMTLRPGLNMLVGPNGSGKTNIILFFEFLSHISSEPLGEAVSRCGGAGSIFRKIGTGDFGNTISAIVEGEFVDRAGDSLRSVDYIYDFTIEISEERDSIFYRNQRVRYFSGKKKPKKVRTWDIDISCNLNIDLETKITIEHIDLRKRAQFNFQFRRSESQYRNREDKVRFIRAFLEKAVDTDTNFLIGLQRLRRDIFGVLNDLVGGEAFNIMPSAAREAEDSATPPGIRKDGSGLAATLYALKKMDPHNRSVLLRGWNSPAPFYQSRVRYAPYGTMVRYPRRLAQVFSPRLNAFERIVEFVRLANDQITNLDVNLDHADNKLKILAIVKNDGEELDLPFSLMSDGTVKWIALIVAIFTYRSIFAIEEPENFIHPLMQTEIAKIMRAASQDKGFRSFVLMTTHSETLLNAATPDEVLVVSMSDGVTKVNRPQNRILLQEEISRTGFGLGHYYLTGALDDA